MQNIIDSIDAQIARLKQARALLTGESEPKRRGRPPKNTGIYEAMEGSTTVSREDLNAIAERHLQRYSGPTKRKPRTAAQKAAQGERMRKYWAARKRTERKAK